MKAFLLLVLLFSGLVEAVDVYPAQPQNLEVVYRESVMAPRHWVASTAQDHNTTSGCSGTTCWAATSGGAPGASIPTSADDVILDGNGTGNCNLAANFSVNSFTVASGYSGTFDTGSYDLDLAGDLTADGSGGFDLGSGSHTWSGDVDVYDQSGWVSGTATVTLDGTSKTANLYGYNTRFQSLVIAGDITLSTSIFGLYAYNLTINASSSLDANSRPCNIPTTMTNNGTLSNVSTLSNSNGTFTLNSGSSIGFTTLNTSYNFTLNGTGSSTLDGNCNFDVVSGARNITFAKDVTFQGNVTFLDGGAGSALTVNNSANNPNLTFQGNISVTNEGGTFTWSGGTGDITISAGANVNLDFDGETVEDIVVDKSGGTATLTGAVSPDGIAVNRGTLDTNGQTVSVGSAGVTSDPVAGAAAFTDSAGTKTNMSITGNIDLNGTATYGVAWSEIDIQSLSATGTNAASYTTVSNSNNSSGNSIDASDNCTDSGGNTGWDFATLVAALLLIDGEWKQYSDESPNYPLCLNTDGSIQAYSDVTGKDPLVHDTGDIRVLAGDETLDR